MEKHRVISTTAAFALAVSAAFAPEMGCVQVPADGDQPVLATHVQDWRDEVVYQLLVDRFADGDINNDYNVKPGALGKYQGGDWKGIVDHLDYLQALGVTTLWISPVVRNVETDADVDAYHGYWSDDLTQTNPHFGDLAALRTLTARAHDAGMKVVLDIVCNHMGQVFFYDMNMNGQPDQYIGGSGQPPAGTNQGMGPPQEDGGITSPVTNTNEYDPDWDPRGVQAYSSAGISGRAPIIFIEDSPIYRLPPKPGILGRAEGYHGFGRILDYGVEQQTLLGDFPGGLKDVNTENAEVRATMVDAYATWVEKADLDGFRIDTVKHVEHEFWQVFAQGIRTRLAAEKKTNFIMFGEAFDGNDQLLGSYTVPGELDSVFYFSQHYAVYRDIFVNAHDPAQQRGTDQIAALWSQRPMNYGTAPQANGIGVPPYRALVNFLDNHDVARFLFDAKGDVLALRNACTLLFTEEGIPDLYYGTEQDFSGGNDPANREVLWNTNFDQSGDTFQHIAELARLRKAYAVLRHGDTKVVWSSPHVATEPDAGLFGFERTGGDSADAYALVVMGTNARATSSAAVQTSAPPGTTLVDVLNPGRASIAVDAMGVAQVTLPPQSAMILIPQAQLVSGT
jgi:glycosidase